jgi:hypothetical protein
MQEERARLAAKAMAELLKPSVTSHSQINSACELSIVQVLAFGFLMVTAAAKRLNPNSRARAAESPFLSIAFNPTADTTILEDYFHSIILESQSDPDELLIGFEEMYKEVKTKKRLRELLRDAQKALRSTDRPGRPSKITQGDWPELLRSSRQFLPFCTALARLQQSARSRPLEDHLDFLRLDHPESVEFLSGHVKKMKSVLSDVALLGQFKTAKTRSTKLADIFAGFAFGVSPQYAMQQALIARRSVRAEGQ